MSPDHKICAPLTSKRFRDLALFKKCSKSTKKNKDKLASLFPAFSEDPSFLNEWTTKWMEYNGWGAPGKLVSYGKWHFTAFMLGIFNGPWSAHFRKEEDTWSQFIGSKSSQPAVPKEVEDVFTGFALYLLSHWNNNIPSDKKKDLTDKMRQHYVVRF